MNSNKIIISMLCILIFGLAFFLRLSLTLCSDIPKYGLGPFGDTHLYNKIAYNLSVGNGFSGIDNGWAYGVSSTGPPVEYKPAVTRGPVYPLFLYCVYNLGGNPDKITSPAQWYPIRIKVRVVQCFLDSLLAILIFFYVRLFIPDSLVPAIISSTLYAFSLYHIYYMRMLLTECITSVLIFISLFFVLLACKYKKALFWGISGIFLGLTSLCRPEYLLFPFFIMAFIFFKFKPKRYKFCLALLIGLVISLTPWTVRNYIVFDEFIPTSVGALGYNLFNGSFENDRIYNFGGRYPDDIFANPAEKKEVYKNASQIGKYIKDGTIEVRPYDQFFFNKFISRIYQHPITVLKNWFFKFPRLWYQNYPRIYRFSEPSGKWFWFYLIFFLFAFTFSRPAIKDLIYPAGLLFVYVNLVYFPIHTEPRYSVPAMTAMIAVSGIGVWLFMQFITKRIHT